MDTTRRWTVRDEVEGKLPALLDTVTVGWIAPGHRAAVDLAATTMAV